jgi:curved DNA-binding protein CbpA
VVGDVWVCSTLMAEKVPRVVPGIDIRKFKLDPMDGFLLTRIDGKLGPKELARDTGLPDFSVARALEKLEKLGIVQIIDPNAPPPPPPQPAPPPAPPPERKSAIAQFDDGLLAPKYDPKELAEQADLTLEQKKRILDFFYRLDDLDHYTLLGITKEADKKGVKRAYFELAAAFHPDRYFKKELGSFKPKMEVLFNRVTEAHDTLVDVSKRTEYDAYLAEVATTRGMEAMLERAMADSARAAAEAERAQAATAAAAVPPPPPSKPAAPAGPTPEELQRRREALARRLTGGMRPPQASRPPSDKPNPLRYSNPQDAMEALKRRYEDRVDNATQAHAHRYIQAAEDALAKNDLVAAATSFNIATKFAPHDVGLAMRAQEVRNLADNLLSESYLKQAQYEERQGHWFEASRSWQKLAKLKNDAVAHERTANALLHSPEGDLHEAAEHAKQAITLQPTAVTNHVTLVEIYLKAGLNASARRAADAAMALDPKHIGLQNVLKRMGRA